jgi:hypothetical protein
VAGGSATFTNYFVGFGVTELSFNTANPIVNTFTGTEDDCTAVITCGGLTATQGYLSFDLHYLIAEAEWSCTSFFGANFVAADFSVNNTDVGNSYGYSGGVIQ